MGTTSVRLFPGDSAARVRGELAAGAAGAGGRFVAPAPAPAPEQSGEGGQGGAVRQNARRRGALRPRARRLTATPPDRGARPGATPQVTVSPVT